ncbi:MULTISPECIES: pirin family protein [unclassified Sphingomonas]|uniref:pirin family protein n=1 Tax=unclassified Sphingomonas TaxID=196159 RepID=UPI0006F72B78|nr:MULTISPECIES: pirin family protein [unclassified Sphingomonas]KQM96572.1 pirin [Sphingomonas sp. Leaf25]KQN39313.1 pirin [Sphingomonas sp. Leaf42]KQT28588.1 pirin [Sphingomonas sp. Leaf407]
MTFASQTGPVEQIILPATRDLGDFSVRRALPSAKRRMVGPFVFLDAFGPVVLGPGQGADTRPHPHIGLSTLTYLIAGESEHRDSAGYAQTIRPGEVNLMTAGRGIVHSERSGPEARARTETMFGFQAWLGLPQALEETDPGFQHVAAGDVPVLSDTGLELRLLAGSFGGRTAPTRLFSDTLYADVILQAGRRFAVDSRHIERAVYVVEGRIAVQGQTGSFGKDELVVFRPGAEIVLHADGPTRLMLMGGEPLDGPRHIFWNFVSSRQDRIDQAADDWRHRRFPGVPGDEVDFIPLPETPLRRAA